MKALLARLNQRLEAWCLVCVLALVGVALLKPSLATTSNLHSYLMVFDITQSMNTHDQRFGDRLVSRLFAAKESARQAIRDLPCGSRVGLAIFTEYRTFTLFAPVEVCGNFAELSAALDRVDGRMSWAGASEIAKGVSFALRTRRALDELPLLVFFTDGHEAPPLDPRYRTRFDDRRNEFRGVLIGIGGDHPVPMPKFGPDGQPLGFWRAQEVLHDDPHNLSRDESGQRKQARAGSEHLSSLREDYLEQLAQEAGLQYLRLRSGQETSDVLRSLPSARRSATRVDGAWIPASAALALLIAVLLSPLARRHQFAPRKLMH